MSDLVKRLREVWGYHRDNVQKDHTLLRQAADLIEQQQARLDELAATVERLRECLNDAIEALVAETSESGSVDDSEIHDLRTLELATPRQNLNEIKRGAFIEGFKSGYNKACDDYDGKGSLFDDLERYAAERYPDKE